MTRRNHRLRANPTPAEPPATGRGALRAPAALPPRHLAGAVLLASLLAALAGSPAHGDEAARSRPAHLPLTLDDAIGLALRNNRRLLDARLERSVQEFALDVAHDRYRPTGSIGPSAKVGRDEDASADIATEAGLRTRAGGRVTLNWSKPLAGKEDTSGTISLGFSQPLLRGFGVAVDTAPLRTARLREEIGVLAFRDTITGVVGATIRAWRSLVRAERQLEIAEASLGRAREQLEVNLKLIQARQMAERERLQNEADIATRELAVLGARNEVATANFALIDILDLESGLEIRPIETPTVQRAVPGLEESIEAALRHSPAWATARLIRKIAAIELESAENNRHWDLGLETVASRPANGASRIDYTVEVRLKVPLGDRSADLRFMRARAGVRRAERGLEELRQATGIAVRQAVRDVEMGLRRIDLARQSRELAKEKLEIERIKLQQGLSSTFQLSQFEEDLVRAQNAELDAAVSYENARTSLDETLGTTLETWAIRVEQVGR